MAQPMQILIVGGVAGGASAAARARRLSEDARIVLFERGADISFANCGMPYHIGGVIADRQRLLVQTPEAFRKRYRVEVRNRCEVIRIDRQRKEIAVRDLATGQEQLQPYDKLILSPGAEAVRPPVPGLDSKKVFTLRNLADMDAIKHAVDTARSRRAVVIGGGYIGLEMAEALRFKGLEVNLVELTHQVFGPIDPEMAQPIHQQLALHGVQLHLGAGVTRVTDDPAGLSVQLSTGQSLACDLAILAIGVKPESHLAKQAGLAIGSTGGILVDDHLRTSDPDIFAIGDAIEVMDLVGQWPALIPLAGPANRQGRIAADNALGRDSVYRQTQGTAICKVFDLAVGITGLSEKTLKRTARPYEKIYVHPADHASYYPGASPVSLKLLFDPVSGQILGAQAVGPKGVDKRIDVLAVAIRAGLTVFHLQDLELSYAPPYGSAKDVINYAGFVAANAIKGDVKLCHTADVVAPRPDQLLLDVRTPAEVEAGTIPGARNIPVDDLRDRLAQLPRDKELLVFCQVGLRGYLACRTLIQNGFNCRNLTGGYKTYRNTVDAASPVAPPPPKQGNNEMKDDAGTNNTATPSASPASARPTSAGPATATDKPATPGKTPDNIAPHKTIDAIGLQCPGPIMRLKAEIGLLTDGQILSIAASDPAFAADAAAWCRSTGNELLSLTPEGPNFRATIARRTAPATAFAATGSAALAAANTLAAAGMTSPATSALAAPMLAMQKKKTIVVFSSDLDKVLAAFIIANGAAAMGSDVTLFFTFWGLNVLRRDQAPAVRKSPIERMFGWMMPRGPRKLTLSKMHMAGMGTAMIKGIMNKKNVSSLPQLIASAQGAGVRLVACTMSMDLMGIHRPELIEGVEEGGVAMYLNQAEQGNVNLFI